MDEVWVEKMLQDLLRFYALVSKDLGEYVVEGVAGLGAGIRRRAEST